MDDHNRGKFYYSHLQKLQNIGFFFFVCLFVLVLVCFLSLSSWVMAVPNQGIFMENGDHNIYNLSQLPMLQNFNQRPSGLRYYTNVREITNFTTSISYTFHGLI